MKTIDEIADFHEDFVKKLMKERGKIVPQVVYCKGDLVVPMVCLTDRDGIKSALMFAQSQKPDWMVAMFEGYNEMIPKEKNESEKQFEERSRSYLSTKRHGDLEQMFKSGEKNVKECVILQVMKGKEMRYMLFEKLKDGSLKKIERTVSSEKDVGGYLALGKRDDTLWK
jgi:hypothetical protein